MGSTARDTQREIGALRGDASAALDEIRARLAGGAPSVATTDARIQGARQAEQLQERVTTIGRERPAVVVAGAGAAGMAVSYLVASFIKKRNSPSEKLKSRIGDVREEAESRLDDARRQAETVGRRIRETRKRGLLLDVKSESDGRLRVKGARLDVAPSKERGRKDVLKNLLWAAVLSICLAVAGVFARRMAGMIWKMTLREDPPTEK